MFTLEGVTSARGAALPIEIALVAADGWTDFAIGVDTPAPDSWSLSSADSNRSSREGIRAPGREIRRADVFFVPTSTGVPVSCSAGSVRAGVKPGVGIDCRAKTLASCNLWP